MANEVRGTQDAHGNVTVRGEAGVSPTAKSIRCMKCNGRADAAVTAAGKSVLRCNICGREYGVTVMR